MKRLYYGALLSLIACTHLHAEFFDIDDRDVIGRSFFHPRSQGSQNAIESSAIPRYFIQDANCSFNPIIVATPGYSSSFDRSSVGRYIFFNGYDTMVTGTAGAAGIDIFGPNFLLNDDFGCAITAKPRATNGFVDFSLWATLDPIKEGLYLFVHAPIVDTHWKVDLIETISSPGSFIGADELGNAVAQAAPVNSLVDAWDGQYTFGDVRQFMQYGRIKGTQKKVALADVEIALGYACINQDTTYLSFNIRTIIPTGTRPSGVYLFEPIAGNGHNWEIGAGIIGNMELWNNGCTQSLSAFLNSSLYTTLKSHQRRTFDLKNNGIGSRYLLFKKFRGGAYDNEIVRGPNILTLDVKVRNSVHGDLALMLDYIFDNWTLDLGYNMWGRSQDKITLEQQIPMGTYGIAGLSGTSGAGRNTTASSTLISGENASLLDAAPVYISNADLNIQSGQHPGTFSNAVFGYLGYTWGSAYEPFLGLGMQLEFAGISNTAFRMWYAYARAGISFF